jgi:tetratricopeptide (TPR) repeat protein
MNPKMFAAFFATLLAAAGLLAPASQPNPVAAARLNNLGCAYMNQQLFEKGLKAFQQAAELDPKLAVARLNEGIAYLNLQKIDEARAALEEARQADPKNPYAWYNLGLLAKNTGDSQPAIDDFKRVTEIDPNDADTWYFLGTAYVQAKQFPQAIDAFQHALQINPLHASAEFGLSRAYQQSAEADHANLDHAREHLKKFQYITQNKIGAPMSLAYGEQGEYSRALESPLAQLKPPAQIKVQFVDVTKEAGITKRPSAMPVKDGALFAGPGACFLDYDNDGKIDLFLPDNGTEGSMSLYHNLGKGKFEDVTNKAGLDSYGPAISCTAGDYDNDGFTDLAVSFGNRILLLHNEKDGTFKDVTQAAGVTTETRSARPPERLELEGLTFVDYDHDGDLDLLVVTRSWFPIVGGGSYESGSPQKMWRNNGNGTFTDVTFNVGIMAPPGAVAALGADYNNDRAVDILVTGKVPLIFQNRREGAFTPTPAISGPAPASAVGVATLDFDRDGWMDLAFAHDGPPAVTLWRNNHGKSFEQVRLPETNWVRAYGVAAFDYDNDGWVDLVAVGETKDGKGEIKLFRNLGPDGFKDVTADVGLDKIHLESPRAIITGDYDNDGAVDLLITQNHGPAVLLKNEGGNQNHWLRLGLKGLNDNKSAIGTKIEVFSGGNRQKFEIYGSNGYLGQNSPYLTVGLGDAKEADIVRMLWPTGVLQDEVQVAGDKQQDITEIDRRGSSCPTLFAWNGERYEFVADMLGAGVVGHWVGPGQRDVPRPVEWVKIPTGMVREKTFNACHPEAGASTLRDRTAAGGELCSDRDCCGGGDRGNSPPAASALPTDVRSLAAASPPLRMTSSNAGSIRATDDGSQPALSEHRESKGPTTVLSFRFMEPLEEAVYLDQVRLLAVDHPAGVEVYPNEYFASNPPYPEFKVVTSQRARPPAGAWDEHGHNVLPDLLAHRYFGDFALTHFLGFAQPHALTLDLGEVYGGGPLWLLLHGEVEYFSANSMYAASQAGIQAIPPYVEALNARGEWRRVVEDMGFPAGGPRTMTADLTGKLPKGTRKIRITTNLQIYWDSILVDRTEQPMPPAAEPPVVARPDPSTPLGAGGRGRPSPHGSWNGAELTSDYRLTAVPLLGADLEYHGYPLKIEGTPPGNLNYIYEQVSATGPYTRPMGTYTRYGDVLPLLTATDDKLAVFGSGDEVRLDFDPSKLPVLPRGWVRDYFFAANGYEKDMDFYAAEGNTVAPLPFLSMGEYPYAPKKTFPLDDEHLNYLLEYNTRHMSGNEQRGYWFDYGEPLRR